MNGHLAAVDDEAAARVVGGDGDGDLVADDDADVEAAHAAREAGENEVLVL